jgi:hypothetical protein
MTKYKTLEEVRAAALVRSLKYYEKIKKDPEKYKEYLRKHREKAKERYALRKKPTK